MSINLDTIKIAKPCSQSWDSMSGDDRMRHCSACELCVFNISEMTRTEAVELIRSRANQRTCIRMYRRPDGTLITRDCPSGTPQKEPVRSMLKTALAAGVTLLATACSPIKNKAGVATMGTPSPIEAAAGEAIMGDFCVPEQPPALPAPKMGEICVIPEKPTVDNGDVVIKDGMIQSIGPQLLAPGKVPAPAAADYEAARTLDPIIAAKAIAFCRGGNDSSPFTVIAARQLGDYFLLSVREADERDGDIHLVYSSRSKTIVGRFAWEWQG